MKTFISIALLSTSLVFAPAAFAAAGSNCHFHGNMPAKEAVVVACATAHKDGLAGKGKLDASWKAAKMEKAETVEGKNMKEWKLSFKNPSEPDASKQTLYLFYTLTGNFIAANFNAK